MPQNTDLVTDLPADFEVFGQAVATSMADLLGGTTGQILAKNSATDMDFVWIANDQGDITGITATAPLTGGGSSGAVTVGIQDALTTQKGAVQLSDSTSTTSSILAATPTAVKSSYDLAAAAIPKSTVTTAGDVIYATGSNAVTRLGIGSTGQVLTVASGIPSWATPAGGSTFVGVSVYGGTLSIPNNTSTAVVFSAENFDTSSFHDNVTNNTRITIPSGKTGYYQVNLASGTFNITSTGTFYFQIKKNGSDIMETPANKFFTGAYMGQGYAWIFYLTAGDYIQLYANQSSGGALDLYSNQANSNFSFSYLGA